MKIQEIFDAMIKKDASDAFVKTESPLKARINTNVEVIGSKNFNSKDIEAIASDILNDSEKALLEKDRSYDLAISKENWRFRVAVFYQSGNLAMVIRKLNMNVGTFAELNMPAKILEQFCNERRGLILLAGSTGSGKSTTIASMISFINKNLKRHVLTIEEPLEFVFEDGKSTVTQREIGKDVASYADALRQFALHSPDVIYIGNIRDRKTCEAVLTAAETGALIFATMHSIDTTSTIETMANFFPLDQQDFAFNQMANLLKGVVSMRLVPRCDAPGLIPAYEVMTLSPTVADLIRKKKLWDIDKYIATGEIHGMSSLNGCLTELLKSKKITVDTAMEYSNNTKDLSIYLRKEGV